MLTETFDIDEVNALIHILHAYGVSYLIGNEPFSGQETGAVDPVHFLQRLAVCHYPLVENATIALLLLHPELTSSVTKALKVSNAELVENLTVVTLATLYLQQWWLFRLTFAFGHLPSFPEEPFTTLWESRQLPAPSDGYGQNGLLALQAYQQQRYGVPLNFLDDWQNQIEHLLAQEELYEHKVTPNVREALLQYGA